MPDETRDADALAERNEAWRRGLAQGANGADADAAQIAKLRKRVGNDRAKTISLIATCVADAVRPLVAEIKQLRERIGALEARPVGLRYVGVWRRGESYHAQDVCTHGGAAWVAPFGDTGDEPGSPRLGNLWRNRNDGRR